MAYSLTTLAAGTGVKTLC